jgi:uncharacterized protein
VPAARAPARARPGAAGKGDAPAVAADPRLGTIAAAHPYPLLFASLSGAHLYGFPSPDSDFDLRGVHVLPLREVVGLQRGPDTIERLDQEHGLDLDLVTHDVAKFARLMRQPNGYVLEQLLSPLVVATTPAHAELRALGRRCATRLHVRHYLGFARSQWRLFESESPPRVKPLLYVYRVLRTGLHLLRTGEVQADLAALDADAPLAGVAELIAHKRAGAEQGTLDPRAVPFHRAAYERLMTELHDAPTFSPLPATLPPAVERELHDFLVRTRLGRVASGGPASASQYSSEP